MADIKPLGEISKKWADVTPGRSAYYESGVRAPRTDWAGASTAAEDAYEAGVSDAMADKRYGKGIREAGTGKWSEKTIEKKARWGEGVRGAQPDFESGFGPYHQVIGATTLPPRYPRGDPRNYDRSKAIGDALHKARVGR